MRESWSTSSVESIKLSIEVVSSNFERYVADALGVGVEIQVNLYGRDAMNAVLGRDALKHAGVGRHE